MDLKPIFKVSALSLLIAAPAITFAQDTYVTPCSFCGLTVGLGLGATTMMSNNKSTSSVYNEIPAVTPPDIAMQSPTLLVNEISTSADPSVYKFGPMARLFAGYGLVYENHSYLGIEGGFNFLGANKTSLPHDVVTASYDHIFPGSPPVFDSTIKSLSTDTTVSRNSIEPFVDLKLGFLSTPTALVYVRGGINYNKITVKQRTAFNAEGTAVLDWIEYLDRYQPASGYAETSFVDSHKKSRSGIGYRVGLGMEFMVTPSLGIGADYVYSFYPRVNSTASHAVTDLFCEGDEGCFLVPGTHDSHAKTTVTDQQVLAQLIYHFGV